MSEVYSIFLSAVFSSFVISIIIISTLSLIYYILYKCFASYISFEKIAHAEQMKSKSLKSAE